MRIIQVVSDKRAGVWYFDKETGKLIEISESTMLNINDMSNIPITGIIVGVSCGLMGLKSYLSSMSLNISHKYFFVAACISMIISYIYASRHVQKLALIVRDQGRKHDLETGVLRYISMAGKKNYIYLGLFTIIIFIIGAASLYIYMKTAKEISFLLMGILSLDVTVMAIVTLHPIQKLLFWIKAGKLRES